MRTKLNPIQAGVFWNHIGWGGGWHIVPPSPLFLLYLWFIDNQTWHGGTKGQNLSTAIKILLRSSLGGKYDVIKPFLVIVSGQNSSTFIFCSMELKFGTGVISEALISNSSHKIRYSYVLKEKKTIFTKNCKFCPSAP